MREEPKQQSGVHPLLNEAMEGNTTISADDLRDQEGLSVRLENALTRLYGSLQKTQFDALPPAFKRIVATALNHNSLPQKELYRVAARMLVRHLLLDAIEQLEPEEVEKLTPSSAIGPFVVVANNIIVMGRRDCQGEWQLVSFSPSADVPFRFKPDNNDFGTLQVGQFHTIPLLNKGSRDDGVMLGGFIDKNDGITSIYMVPQPEPLEVVPVPIGDHPADENLHSTTCMEALQVSRALGELLSRDGDDEDDRDTSPLPDVQHPDDSEGMMKTQFLAAQPISATFPQFPAQQRPAGSSPMIALLATHVLEQSPLPAVIPGQPQRPMPPSMGTRETQTLEEVDVGLLDTVDQLPVVREEIPDQEDVVTSALPPPDQRGGFSLAKLKASMAQFLPSKPDLQTRSGELPAWRPPSGEPLGKPRRGS